MNYNPVVIDAEYRMSFMKRDMTDLEIMGIEFFMNNVLEVDYFGDATIYANQALHVDTDHITFTLPDMPEDCTEYESWTIDRICISGTQCLIAIIYHPDDEYQNNPVHVRLN